MTSCSGSPHDSRKSPSPPTRRPVLNAVAGLSRRGRILGARNERAGPSPGEGPASALACVALALGLFGGQPAPPLGGVGDGPQPGGNQVEAKRRNHDGEAGER